MTDQEFDAIFERVQEAAVRADAGVPDVIINNAGAGRWKALVDTETPGARAVIEVPYLAALYVTRAFLPDMLRRGSGQVVNVTSPASYLVWPNACGYVAARRALKGFTEALRAELRGSGVGVSLVVLGTVNSPYWEHNPGSREHLPRSIPLLMAELSLAQAAETVVRAVERGARRIVRPTVFRALFILSALRGGG